MTETVKVAIIGSGPAGYTAGVYTARAALAPTLFAGYQSGGQLMFTSDIENFPGFPTGVNGPLLMQQMRDQAAHFGAQIRDEYVTAVDFSQRPFRLWTNLPTGIEPEVYTRANGSELSDYLSQIKLAEPALLADSVIVTTGAVAVMLGLPNEQKLYGRGVSTCAVCDAAFYRDKDTVVVGGGDSAMEDTLALTKFARSVTVIHRRSQFRASKIMQDRVLQHPKVKVLWESQVIEIVGEEKLTGITVKNAAGQSQTLKVDGLFIAIGHKPITGIFADQLQLDAHGYIVTRQSLSQAGHHLAASAISADGLMAFPSSTSVEGVFAAGDVVDVRYKQAITAAGQGCAAALDAERWLEQQPASGVGQ